MPSLLPKKKERKNHKIFCHWFLMDTFKNSPLTDTRNFNRFNQTFNASCNVFWECFSFTDKWQSPKALLEAYILPDKCFFN